MSDPGYEYLIERDPEFAADDGYDKSYWVYRHEIRRGRYNEGFMSNMGKDGQHLYSIIYKFDGWDGSVQEYGKTEEDAIQNAIAKGKIDDEDEIVKIVDLGEKGKYLESSKKLVKEGAGAGYDVGISDLTISKVTEIKKLDDGDYSFTATIMPGFYEISASDYYNDFFWQEHEFGDTPEAKIDGGEIHGTISTWEDTDDPEEWVRYQVEGTRFNLSFMYGGGWAHANLPEDGQLYIDEHIEINPEPYFSVDDIQLDAIDLVQAVNAGYASLDDRDSDEGGEEDEGELMNESLDEDWHTVTKAFDEFNQKLWNYSKQKPDERLSAFRDCSKKCEKALRDYYNAVVYDGVD